jgi:hypothetical protein
MKGMNLNSLLVGCQWSHSCPSSKFQGVFIFNKSAEKLWIRNEQLKETSRRFNEKNFSLPRQLVECSID